MSGNDLQGLPITIVGAGAIGGTVGAFLHDAGYNVTLVEVCGLPGYAATAPSGSPRSSGRRCAGRSVLSSSA
jgi:2-polyprenyl-6-methoxyphenol hydroxylase-like FAD-dependent oxidoreductase